MLLVIKTLDIKRYVCIRNYLAEISAHNLQLKCMDGHFFSMPSLHTVLSDTYTFIYPDKDEYSLETDDCTQICSNTDGFTCNGKHKLVYHYNY